MATVEHCLYCFESLAAKLENREALSLSAVQKSYIAYLAAQPPSTKKIPALRRLNDDPSPSSSSSSSLLDSGSSSSTSLSSANTAATIPSPAAPRTRITDPSARYPLFVTWDKRGSSSPSSSYNLRGCIGTFSASEPLYDTLSEYALVSALHDTRFRPVTLRELPLLRCCVTLLTDFEDCADIEDWVVGEHGIRISFTLDGRRYGSTYLPSVASEQGWDKEETLVSLMRKAGWEGRRGSWRDAAAKGGMKVERYRGDKEEVEYATFAGWNEWVGENWKGEEDDDDE